MKFPSLSNQHLLVFKPPRIAMTLLAAAALLQVTTPSDLARLPASAPAGIVVGVLGFAMMLRAWWLFRQHATAICPTATTTSLIESDIYRLTRNPMYLGMVLMLSGTAVLLGSWPFYLAAVVYFLILDRVFCRFEEQKLADQYGARYQDYCVRVRRWL